MPQDADPDQEQARSYVRDVLKATGWTSTELARKAGLAPSTLNRFLNQEVKHTLSSRSLAKIEKVAGRVKREPDRVGLIARLEREVAAMPADSPKIRRNRETLLATIAELEKSEALGYAMQGRSLEEVRNLARQMHFVMVRGMVEAGAWREAVEWPDEDWFPVGVSGVERYDPYPQFGLVVRGPSMNQVYPEGSILICVSFLHLGRPPTHGERVVVEHRRGGFVEATVKEFAVENGRPKLYARSDHPRYAGAIDLPAEGEPEGPHDDEIRVSALVIASIRPEPTR